MLQAKSTRNQQTAYYARIVNTVIHLLADAAEHLPVTESITVIKGWLTGISQPVKVIRWNNQLVFKQRRYFTRIQVPDLTVL